MIVPAANMIERRSMVVRHGHHFFKVDQLVNQDIVDQACHA